MLKDHTCKLVLITKPQQPCSQMNFQVPRMLDDHKCKLVLWCTRRRGFVMIKHKMNEWLEETSLLEGSF